MTEFEGQIRAMCEKNLIPHYMVDGVVQYAVHHIEPGGFLRSLLENDLQGAIMRADAVNSVHIRNWVGLLCDLPRKYWGSEEVVNAHLAKRTGVPLTTHYGGSLDGEF